MLLGCLAFLALGSTSAKVLNWILKLVPLLFNGNLGLMQS